MIGPAGRAGEFVWLEGEEGRTDVKVGRAGWGNAEFLSGASGCTSRIDADKVEAEVPGDAVAIRVPVRDQGRPKYEVWNRIGFEFVRSPFEWRIDDGAWKKIAPTN